MNKNGFTLIELSIVLVIIGLIVGGALVGQDLIHAAKIRAVQSDAQKVEIALLMFKSKYGSLPGDMGNQKAYMFFQGNTYCTNPFRCGRSTPDNGNENGWIMDYHGSGGNIEDTAAWAHIFYSGLYEVNWSEHSVSTSDNAFGIPETPMGENSFWVLYNCNGWYFGNTGCLNNKVYGKTGHFLWAGGTYTTGIAPAQNSGLFTPTEAYNMDVKFDNGDITSGKIYVRDARVQSGGGGAKHCTSLNHISGPVLSTTATINLTNNPDEPVCNIGYKLN